MMRTFSTKIDYILTPLVFLAFRLYLSASEFSRQQIDHAVEKPCFCSSSYRKIAGNRLLKRNKKIDVVSSSSENFSRYSTEKSEVLPFSIGIALRKKNRMWHFLDDMFTSFRTVSSDLSLPTQKLKALQSF